MYLYSYCENRDFDSKMHNVLLVYKQLSMQFDEDGHLIPWAEDKEFVHVLSYDEKPGIQAIATTSEDLLPDERHGRSAETMSTSVLGRCHCWQESTYRPERPSQWLARPTTARTISNF